MVCGEDVGNSESLETEINHSIQGFFFLLM